MNLSSWYAVNGVARQNLPYKPIKIVKGKVVQGDPKQYWKTFYRIFRQSVGWGNFMLVLEYMKDGKKETINMAMKALDVKDYAAIMYARGEWEVFND